jgi:hypothetical protein
MSKPTPHFNAMIAARGGAGKSAADCYKNSAGIAETPDFNRQTAGNTAKPRTQNCTEFVTAPAKARK